MELNTIITEQVTAITASLTEKQMRTVKNNAILASLTAAALTIAYYKLSN